MRSRALFFAPDVPLIAHEHHVLGAESPGRLANLRPHGLGVLRVTSKQLDRQRNTILVTQQSGPTKPSPPPLQTRSYARLLPPPVSFLFIYFEKDILII